MDADEGDREDCDRSSQTLVTVIRPWEVTLSRISCVLILRLVTLEHLLGTGLEIEEDFRTEGLG